MITLLVRTASAKTFWRCGRMFSESPQTVEVTDEEALVILGEPALKAEEVKSVVVPPADLPTDPPPEPRAPSEPEAPPAPKPEPKRK